MVRATGINHYLMIALGLMVANGLAGLSGSLVVQQFGFADVSLGFGLIIRGLAAVIIGEVLLRPRSTGQMLVAAGGGHDGPLTFRAPGYSAPSTCRPPTSNW